jgi:hypothetical protein
MPSGTRCGCGSRQALADVGRISGGGGGRTRSSLSIRRQGEAPFNGVPRRKKDVQARNDTRTEATVKEYRQQISVDPAICHGQPCIKGTRVPPACLTTWPPG